MVTRQTKGEEKLKEQYKTLWHLGMVLRYKLSGLYIFLRSFFY